MWLAVRISKSGSGLENQDNDVMGVDCAWPVIFIFTIGHLFREEIGFLLLLICRICTGTVCHQHI